MNPSTRNYVPGRPPPRHGTKENYNPTFNTLVPVENIQPTYAKAKSANSTDALMSTSRRANNDNSGTGLKNQPLNLRHTPGYSVPAASTWQTTTQRQMRKQTDQIQRKQEEILEKERQLVHKDAEEEHEMKVNVLKVSNETNEKALERERVQIQMLVEDIRTEKARLDVQLGQERTAVGQMQDRWMDQQAELVVLKTQKEHLQKTVEEHRREVDGYKLKAAECHAAISLLSADQRMCDENMAAQKQKMEKYKAEVQQTKQALVNTEKMLDMFQTELDKVDEHILDLRDQLDQQKLVATQLEKRKQDENDQLDQLALQMDTKRKTVSSLSREIEKKNRMIAAIHELIAKENDRIMKLEKNKADQTVAFEKEQECIRKAKEQTRSEHDSEYLQMTQELEQLEASVAEDQRALDQTSQEFRELVNFLQSLKDQLVTLQERRSKGQLVMGELETKLQDHSMALEEAKQQIDSKKTALKTCTIFVDTQIELNAAVDSAIHDLKVQLVETQRAADAQLRTTMMELDTLRSDLDMLKLEKGQSIMDMETEKGSIESQYENTLMEIESEKQVCSKLQASSKSVEDEISSLHQEIRKCELGIRNALERKGSLRAEVDAKQSQADGQMALLQSNNQKILENAAHRRELQNRIHELKSYIRVFCHVEQEVQSIEPMVIVDHEKGFISLANPVDPTKFSVNTLFPVNTDLGHVYEEMELLLSDASRGTNVSIISCSLDATRMKDNLLGPKDRDAKQYPGIIPSFLQSILAPKEEQFQASLPFQLSCYKADEQQCQAIIEIDMNPAHPAACIEQFVHRLHEGCMNEGCHYIVRMSWKHLKPASASLAKHTKHLGTSGPRSELTIISSLTFIILGSHQVFQDPSIKAMNDCIRALSTKEKSVPWNASLLTRQLAESITAKCKVAAYIHLPDSGMDAADADADITRLLKYAAKLACCDIGSL